MRFDSSTACVHCDRFFSISAAIDRRQRPIQQRPDVVWPSSACPAFLQPRLRRIVVRPGSLALCRSQRNSFPARADGRNAIENGIHSVGTNPSGSTMPSRAAFAVSFACRSPRPHRWPCWRHRAGSHRHSAPPQRAPRQNSFVPAAAYRSSPSPRTALHPHSPLPPHRDWPAQHKASCRRAQAQRRTDAYRARSALGGFSSASLRPTVILCQIEFHNLRRIPQRDKRPAPILRQLAAQSDKSTAPHRSRPDRSDARFAPVAGSSSSTSSEQILRDQQLLRAGALQLPQWPRETALPCRHPSRQSASSCARRELLQRQMDQPLRLNLAIGESIHHDAAARVGMPATAVLPSGSVSEPMLA